MDKRQKVALFRERFYGRQDMYGRQWQTTKEDGSVLKGYAPVCGNFWSSGCHLKTRSGTTCAKCEIKEYSPVTDDSVWLHISGQEKQIQYLVQDNGTIKFAAFDFDCKPGKESEGYTFVDVKVVSKLLTEEGVPHAIARSTTAGYHLYLFMDNFYSAYKFRSLAYWIFERVGFMEQMRQGIRALPEIFPKQNYVGFGPGNGICPSAIEPQWEKGRNGLVDNEDNFIPGDRQWAYLASISFVSAKHLDSLLEKHGIEIDETPATSPAEATRRAINKNFASGRGQWQQPLTGSFEKVVEGCAAVRRVFDKAKKGLTPGHHEGFAAFHLAMQCSDGIDIFKERMSGWGKTEKEWSQLQHSIDKSYAPWTCRKMQEHGVCIPNTKCFERKPPIIVVEGQYVAQTDIPESEWPEPGPIRYAYGKGDDFLEKLKREIDEIVGESDEHIKGNKLRDVAKRSQVFDDDQQRILREYIKNKKLIKANDLSKMFNKAHSEHTKDTKEKASSRSDTVTVGTHTYQVLEPKGYAVLKMSKEGPEFERISNCIVEIEENKAYLEDDNVIGSYYKGRLMSETVSIPFEISQSDWWENRKFISYFGQLGTEHFNVLKDDIDYLRAAALAFSARKGIVKCNNLVTQGWYQGTYLMPSVLVDKDSMRPNTEKVIDLTTKQHASFLDFKILEDDEFRSLSLHLINDYLNTWPRKWTMVCLAHALLPAIMNPMQIRKKPSLFLEGTTGSGKTELLHTTQYFWGEFDSIVNLVSTGKGLQMVAHDFKDAMVVFDDYKGLNFTQIEALQRIIQYSYDPNSSVKLDRSSKLRKPVQTRGIIAFTGEHFIENDAAMVARTLLLEVTKQDTTKTREKYQKCIMNRHLYNGFTPRFIHWFLQQDIGVFQNELNSLQRTFLEPLAGRQNADRVAYNGALNHFLWRLFVSFMYEHGFVLNPKDLLDEHIGYIKEIQLNMLDRCGDSQTSEVFERVLLQMIISGDVIVEGFNDCEDTKNKPIIGFTNKTPYGVRTLNLLPEKTCEIVKRNCKVIFTEMEIGRQFKNADKIVDHDPNRYKKLVRWKGGHVRVWCIDMRKFGLYTGEMDVIQGGQSKTPVAEQDLPIVQGDGSY